MEFHLDNQAYLGILILHLLKTRWDSVDFKNLCKLRTGQAAQKNLVGERDSSCIAHTISLNPLEIKIENS